MSSVSLGPFERRSISFELIISSKQGETCGVFSVPFLA